MIQETTVPVRILLRAFPGIPIVEAKELIASGVVRAYPADTILCHEDAYETTFYILLNGRVNVTKKISGDQVRLLKVLESGDFFGEMGLLQEAPRAATVTTVIPTTVLEIHKEPFKELVHSSTSLARAMMQEVVRRLRQNDAMAIEDLRFKAGELAAAYQRLAEQEYARSAFLSTIAHELRTPLTAANGFLQMVEMGLLDGQNVDREMQQAALQTASRNLQQIITLVNDILFLQEMDLILPSFTKTSIDKVLEAAAADCQARLLENDVSLKMQVSPELPYVMADPKSLERAFAAVLDNAIKFSHQGGEVEVTAGTDVTWIWVKIQDHGLGIPENVLPRIFERFFHIDQMGDRLFRGVGLGLAIARQVIEQHGGTIDVTSKPGEGTLVTIRLKAV